MKSAFFMKNLYKLLFQCLYLNTDSAKSLEIKTLRCWKKHMEAPSTALMPLR